MQAVIPDKRRKRTELTVVCTQCGWPQIELVPEVEQTTTTPVKDKPHKLALAISPGSEEEAIKVGWLETELGLICPICAGQIKYEEALAVEDGSETHAGIGGMTTALAGQIAEANGEAPPDRIADEDIPLPTIHHLVPCGDSPMIVGGNGTGRTTCSRCHKTWSFVVTDGNYTTTPAYTRECIPAPSTESVTNV